MPYLKLTVTIKSSLLDFSFEFIIIYYEKILCLITNNKLLNKRKGF